MGFVLQTGSVSETKNVPTSVPLEEQHAPTQLHTPVTQWRVGDSSRDWRVGDSPREQRAGDDEDKYGRKSWSRGVRHWLK